MTRAQAFYLRMLFPRALPGREPSLQLTAGDLTLRLDLQWRHDAYLVQLRSNDGAAHYGTVAKDGRVSLREELPAIQHAPLLAALDQLAAGESLPALMCRGARASQPDVLSMPIDPGFPEWETFSRRTTRCRTTKRGLK
jgi:hypothetical protein